MVEPVIWLLDADVWAMIREMRDRGMKITNISEDLRMNRPTVRRYLRSWKPPEYMMKRQVSKLEEFKP